MFIGTGEGESAHGKNEMANYITQDIQEIPEPFTVGVTIVHEQQQIGENICNISIGLTLKIPCIPGLAARLLLSDEGAWRVAG